MKLLIVYLLIINVLGFVFMLVDKQKAKKGAWRIPEATLMGIAAAGGSFGSLFGMRVFRHKTKHAKFYIGIPVFVVVHLGLLIWLVPKFL